MPPLIAKLPAGRRTLPIARLGRRLKRPKLFSRSIQMIRCNTSISLITDTGDEWPAAFTGEAGDTLAGSIGGGGDTLAGCTVGPDDATTTDEASQAAAIPPYFTDWTPFQRRSGISNACAVAHQPASVDSLAHIGGHHYRVAQHSER